MWKIFRTKPIDQQSGFTVIELVAVAVLIGVFALIIGARMSAHLDSGHLDEARHRFKQVIRDAQQSAITENRSYRLSWDIGGNLCRTLYDNGSVFVEKKTDAPPDRVSLTSTTFTSDQLNFDVSGNPSMGGSIVLTDSGGRSASITVSAGSGIVTLP